MATAALYTPEVLGLATGLAAYPWDDALPLKADARSKSCGSTIALALALDAEGRIARIALRSQACAIGQAAAAIFAEAASGRDARDIARADDAITAWLAGEGGLPDWPGLAAIAAARDYPARHGAIRLAWQAARQLLPTD
ncbi:iron-sulfur cluster assembly scaffold protein [Novosphingobium sp. JCM 18896]|uniref:iron-sulfur cluster assembly scaffold protein n=1 Tax=Novosphingobium sp. JCM 18896 TaxID=2989731 RepID=UPI002221F74B|nr:iron-sulfur cluster assembly scaffold protein [Novosphingobium sp. JCM 18896]MCW1428447.1 iron-sulfur cluster assembly scaffold protein [Novosphingobium sp. JCM 18896]